MPRTLTVSETTEWADQDAPCSDKANLPTGPARPPAALRAAVRALPAPPNAPSEPTQRTEGLAYILTDSTRDS